MVGWGECAKKIVPLHANMKLSHGATEDQSDMMMTTSGDESKIGRDTVGCGDPKTYVWQY